MTVIWITGLAGAGKTTAAHAVATRLRAQGATCIILDGDALREALSPLGAGYDPESRRRLAMTYSGIALLLSEQGLSVIVATVSLFAAVHAANRRRFRRYIEVLLTCDEGERNRRRPPVAAQWPVRDLAVELPTSPHLTIDTNACDPDNIAAQIVGLAAGSPAE
jgi:adenylylsulfate kinase-like enzyme